MLEGEGSISIHSTNQFYTNKCRKVYSPYVGITNTDLTIVNAISDIACMGRIVARNRHLDHHHTLYEWKLTALIPALKMCELIVNDMKSARKKEIVNLVIEFCRSRLCPTENANTLPYRPREIEIYHKVAELNKRGHSSSYLPHRYV
jgi:hypothetical protein